MYFPVCKPGAVTGMSNQYSKSMRKLLSNSAWHEYVGLLGSKHHLLVISEMYLPSQTIRLNLPVVVSIHFLQYDLLFPVHKGDASLGHFLRDITKDLELLPLNIVRHIHSYPEGYKTVIYLRPPDDCYWGNVPQYTCSCG